MLDFNWYPFSKLTNHQVYNVLALRSAVFVVEQNCPYLDTDSQDFDAIHLLGTEKNLLQAYLRLLPPSKKQKDIIFGRVVTAPDARKQGYGKKLIDELLTYSHQYFPQYAIKCSAQFYLKKFYESFGFKTLGEPYQEDGIPHIAMIK